MKKLYFLFSLLFICSISFGQTILYQEDFETDTNGTNYNTSIAEFSDIGVSSGYDFFTRTDGSNIGSGYVVNGQSGSFYFAGMDIDGEGATLPVSLTTISIDVSGQSSIDAVILLAEDDDSTNQDWDASDYLHITYSIDGGAAQNLLWVESDIDSNGTPKLDSDFDGVGDGTEITSSFAEFVGTIPLSGATSIVFTLEFNLNSGDEDIAIDNIRIYDSYVVPPTILVSAGVSDLDYETGSGPSAEGSFTVEGTDLTDNILVTAPTDFEVSLTSGSGFGPSVMLTQASGIVASTTIYARLKSGLAINAYSGDVSVTSTDATTKTVSLSGDVYDVLTNSLVITGVYDAKEGSAPKGVELLVLNDIADLSLYGVGSANNGGGTDGEEFTFPADAVTAGTFIYVSSEETVFTTFFGVAPTYNAGSPMLINGDDAIELFESGQVIDTFGDINTDGSGTAWDYVDGWAYRVDGTGPDGATFVLANWTFSGTGNLDGIPNNAASTSPFPTGSYSTTVSTEPTVTLVDGPANGSTLELPPNDLTGDLEFSTTNFVVDTNPNGDGYIAWSLEEQGVGIHDSGNVYDTSLTYPFNDLIANTTYVFTAELLTHAGASLSPAVVYSFTVHANGYTMVADLATLRDGTIGGNNYYHVTGEIIGTYARANRNQKYAQDATGGILIDDADGVITTTYNEGDGITGLKGQLSEYLGVLQLVPTEDPGMATSTGNIITPEVVTIADLLNGAATDVYESELVEIQEVTFTETGTFGSGQNYTINDASTVTKSTASSMTLRTSFSEADYIGTAIPTETLNLVVFVAEFNGTAQVVPRTSTDILLGIKGESIDGFALYPNPVSNGFITITTPNNLEKKVNIFDILGKQVYGKTIQNGEKVNVSNLNTGIYILRVEEDAKIATRKLIIR